VSSTRRELLAGAAGTRHRVAGRVVRDDAEILAALLRLERAAGYAYDHLLHTVRLGPVARKLVREFAAHEHAHAQVVESALAEIGAGLPVPPSGPRQYERVLGELHVRGRLSRVHREQGALAYLIALEMISTGSWHDAVSALSDPGLFGTAAAIMACEAQHTAQLRILSHPGHLAAAAPVSFVTGRR
jgi:hypothetical protein